MLLYVNPESIPEKTQQSTIEEIGTLTKPTTFLSEVESTTRKIEQTLQDLRTTPHPNKGYGHNFKLEDHIPEDSLQGISLDLVESVLTQYLEQVPTLEFQSQDSKSLLEANTSTFPFQSSKWSKEVYTPNHRIIKTAIEGLEERIEGYANLKVQHLLKHLQGLLPEQSQAQVDLILNGHLAYPLRQLQKQLLDSTKPQYQEDPTKLYEIVFKELIIKKDLQSDQEIIEFLEQEKIPKDFYEKITGIELQKPTITEITERKLSNLDEGSAVKRGNPQSSANNQESNSNITILMPYFTEGNTFAQALHNLRDSHKNGDSPLIYTLEDGTELIRSPSLAELIKLKVEDFNSESDEDIRKRLFTVYLGTCSAMAYLENTTQCKLIPISESLLTLSKDFNQAGIILTPEEYHALDFPEFNTDEANFNEAIWQAGVPDKKVRQEYRQIISSLCPNQSIMDVRTLSQQKESQIRSLCVCSLGVDFNLGGSYCLDGIERFVRVTQNFSTGNRG